jgi:hypothetical protein
MADYSQMNPGKHHLGYRFPTPLLADTLQMHIQDEHKIELKYKSAIVIGRTLYVGNVQVFNREQGTIRVEGDAMYKSIVNQFDSFAGYNKIEAAINDGDDITALARVGNKILQFKNHTLYIINVSGSIEVLEGTHKHKGVNNPAAVCETDYGVAWANENGCYLYDGKSITDLLEKNALQKIKESEWESFIVNPMVGYFPRKRQIIVVDDYSTGGAGTCYLYDLVTTSWTKSSAAKFQSAIKSNFQNDRNGNLIYGTPDGTDTDATAIKQWSDTSVSSSGFSLVTKDLDFGQPSVRKKIYKAYVSYKGDGSAVTLTYSVNGDTDTVANFYKIGSSGSTTGATDSNTPLHSSTVGTDDWVLAELKPVAAINNKYSFRLHFGGTAGADFKINDISVVYRIKNIK